MDVEDLLLALEMAPAASREALLKAAPRNVREELMGELAYREMVRTPPPNALVVAMDAADDTQCKALWAAATPAQRNAAAEELSWRGLTEHEAAMRYRAMLGVFEPLA